MISTEDGRTFVLNLKCGTVEISKDELEHLVIEGEILLHELLDLTDEPHDD